MTYLTNQFPFFFVLFVAHLVLTFFIMHALFEGLKARNIASKKRELYEHIGRIGVILVFWLVVVLNLVLTGTVQGTGGNVSLLIAFLLPLAVGLWIVFGNRCSDILDKVPDYWFLAIQAMRIPYGLILLREHELGVLPETWRMFAGWGEIVSGIVAVIAAFILIDNARAKEESDVRALILGNAFGLLTYLVLVPTALIGFIHTPPVYSINMLLVFSVPLFLIVHVLSLKKTRGALKGK